MLDRSRGEVNRKRIVVTKTEQKLAQMDRGESRIRAAEGRGPTP